MKRQRSDSAAVSGEVVMVLQLLRKHKECKKAKFVGYAEGGDVESGDAERSRRCLDLDFSLRYHKV